MIWVSDVRLLFSLHCLLGGIGLWRPSLVQFFGICSLLESPGPPSTPSPISREPGILRVIDNNYSDKLLLL